MTPTALETRREGQPGSAAPRMSPAQGIIGAIAGYVVGSIVLFLLKVLAGLSDFGTEAGTLREMIGIGDAFGNGAGLVGAVFGFVGGFAGWHLFRRPGFVKAWWGGAIGLVIGVVATLLVRDIAGLEPFFDRQIVVFGITFAFLGYTWGIGAWPLWWNYILGRPTPEHEDHSDHGARHWTDYFKFNTDHKVIGVQYLVTTFFFMLIGGFLALLMRAELAEPGLQFTGGASEYNQALTLHGIIMLLMFIIPVFAGLANYVLPLMIGAPDMAFPRLNALSYWMLLFGGVVFLAGIPFGFAEAGWTNYAPLSSTFGVAELPLGQLFFIMGVQLIGSSSILTAINFLVSIIGMRAPGMTMWRMPLLVWANFTTSLLVVFGTPFIAGSQFMVMLDSIGNFAFFDPARGGDPISYQHIFWFYSHPAVYIMMLPGFGIISEVITSHARKPLFGYRALAISTIAIGFLGFTVWAHHMFTSGMPPWFRLPMMITTMLIAVPTGMKVLGWTATLWQGRLHLTTAMLFALGFLINFTIGGITGIMLAAVPFDIHVHDTYFVVAHFHYVLFGGSVLTVFAGIYHWFPKMTGRMYDERLGKLHFALTFIGMTMTFFPMHWVGTLAMPRRVADYQFIAEIYPSLTGWNFVITIGAFIQGIAFVVFVYNMAVSWGRGGRAPANPWRSHTLEWHVPSPPPLFNFHETPRVVGAPYDFGVPGARHAVVDWVWDERDKPFPTPTGADSTKETQG